MARAVTHVLLTGPDGSGKSAIIDNIGLGVGVSRLRLRLLHFQPNWEVADCPGSVLPHDQAPRSCVGGALVVVIRAVRYGWSWQRGLLAGKGQDVVIQQRGWYDQLIDPLRYRNPRCVFPLVGLLGRLQPRFDLHVRLEGSPSAIQERKPELDSAEVERQLEGWRSLSLSDSATPLSTTELSVAETRGEFIRALLNARRIRLQQVARRYLGAPGRLEACGTRGSQVAFTALYRPLSRRGSLARSARVIRPLGKNAKNDHVCRLAVSAIVGLGLPADSFAAIRSAQRNRVVVATVVEGRVDAFVKVAPSSDHSLRSELDVLTHLKEVAGMRVPSVLGVWQSGGLLAFALSPIGGSTKNPAVCHETALQLSISLSRASDTGVTHGDLTPWNVLDGRTPGLVDWESASFGVVPGYDLGHYIITAGSGHRSELVPWSPDWREWPIWREYVEATGFSHDDVIKGASEAWKGSRANNKS